MKRILIVAFATLPAVTLAQQPGEVVLQVSAAGSVQRPADEATETLALAGTGETREAARAALDAKLAGFRSALAGAGVPAAAQTVDIGVVVPEMLSPIVPVPSAPAGSTPSVAAKRPFRASANIVLKLSDPALIKRVADLARAQGAEPMGPPRYSLKDDKAARAAAAADALAQARANAEQYAGAMKMRIVRVTRVADYGQNLDISQFADFATLFDPAKRGGAEVTVRVRIWMDFVMAPF